MNSKYPEFQFSKSCFLTGRYPYTASLNSGSEDISVKKAHVHFISDDALSEKQTSALTLELDESATDDDLMKTISELEEKKQMVCDNWMWLSDKDEPEICPAA